MFTLEREERVNTNQEKKSYQQIIKTRPPARQEMDALFLSASNKTQWLGVCGIRPTGVREELQGDMSCRRNGESVKVATCADASHRPAPDTRHVLLLG